MNELLKGDIRIKSSFPLRGAGAMTMLTCRSPELCFTCEGLVVRELYCHVNAIHTLIAIEAAPLMSAARIMYLVLLVIVFILFYVCIFAFRTKAHPIALFILSR